MNLYNSHTSHWNVTSVRLISEFNLRFIDFIKNLCCNYDIVYLNYFYQMDHQNICLHGESPNVFS